MATPQEGGVQHTVYKSSVPRGQRGYRVNITWKDVRLIGKGAFGSVLLQESCQQFPPQLRAVKKLVASKDSDFKTELTTLCEVTKYNDLFVELFGWYEAEGNLFIAMEYVQFGDLSMIAKEERRTHARTIARQTLCALNILHEGGICHRDIKPQNILVASLDPFRIKIADFGASKYLAAEEDFSIVGTPGYMAPELLKMAIIPRSQQGEAIYTLAVDLWSLGCVIHEMLTFRIPFSYSATASTSTAMSGFHLLYQFCQGQSVFPSDDLRSAQATEEQMSLVLGLLVPNPKNRMAASQALQSDWLRTEC
ncbi:kinase-like domain-containing protein [Morchella snyderi]|nr:kinase-like domain-containing protein [Morchella snyderi]